MNSIAMDTIKALVEHKKYDAITEYANVLHGKDNLIVSEYGGANVRLYKDAKNNAHILCPKNMDTVQEGYLASAIANGSVFDDADEIDRNAEVIERTTLPYDAMVNGGKEPPQHLRPMIAIIVGRMGDDGKFGVTDADRTNGINFVKDATAANANGEKVNDVVDNYLEKEDNGFYTPEIGKNISGLNNELGDVNSTDPGDVVSDDDTVDSYDDYDMDAIERDPDTEADHDEPVNDVPPADEPDDDSEGENTDPDEQLDVDNGEDEANNDEEGEPGEVPDGNEVEDDEEDYEEGEDLDSDEPMEVDECGNCIPTDTNKAVVQEEDDAADTGSEEAATEPTDASTEDMGEDASAETTEEAAVDSNIKGATETGTATPTPAPMSAQTKAILNNQVHQEGFLTKRPKKLKPIGRDVVAYITCEMNAIHSSNDQAMLAGYTCSKIELVDWYITVLDTQDPKYIVPHTRQYLVTMKAQLESLLAQILKIRPINRSEQIWRVNYPTA